MYRTNQSYAEYELYAGDEQYWDELAEARSRALDEEMGCDDGRGLLVEDEEICQPLARKPVCSCCLCTQSVPLVSAADLGEVA